MLKKQKINESEVMKFGFLGGAAEALYVLFVVLFINILDLITPFEEQRIAGPILMLLLFVVSAGISGILVFGYPAYLALQKRYVESLMTAVTTFLTLGIIVILVLILASFV